MFLVRNNANYVGYYNFSTDASEFRMASGLSTSFQTIKHGQIFSYNSFTDLNALYIGSATAFNGVTFSKSKGYVMQASGAAEGGTCFTHDQTFTLGTTTF